MDDLLRVVKTLRALPDTKKVRVPQSWDLYGFDKGERLPDGALRVPAGAFFAHAIERGVLLSRPVPMRNSVDTVYCMLARMFTAYDYHRKDIVEPGTFVRALALLPLLERMGADTVYLLPVFAHSRMHNKGEWGSPYAIKDFFALDPEQHDPLLGEYADEKLDMQFRAFVQGCHARGMRVMLDFVFRTCARDNVLIKEHPDWFYWIAAEEEEAFCVPYVRGYRRGSVLNERAVKNIYAQPETETYIGRFRHDPQTKDPALFAQICAQGGNILEKIEKRMGLTTAPAFSDVVNDPQPPWTDVTYLRFDLKPTAAALKAVGGGAPPFVLHDAIKLNRFPAREPNDALVSMIREVIPFYIENFGIDGARVDMAHALDPALNRGIVALAREKKPDFVFWSEQLDIRGDRVAKDEGFDFISGDVWGRYAHANERLFGARLTRGLHACALPYAAAMELPDTPRAALLVRPAARRTAFTLFNALLPGSVVLIDSGQETAETQPMNLGLGESEEGRFTLPDSDPMQGRLAFFDPYRLHWDKLDEGLAALEKAYALRRGAQQTAGAGAGAAAPRYPGAPWAAAVLWRGDHGRFFAVMNTGRKKVRVRLSELFRPGALKRNVRVYTSETLGAGKRMRRAGQTAVLRPGELLAGRAD